MQTDSHYSGHGTQADHSIWSSAREVNALLGISDSHASDEPMFNHKRIKAGQYALRAGQSFDSLYVVNGGFLKTIFTDDSGNEQIVGFPGQGDLIGADGIGSRYYVNDVVALSDADLVIIPFKCLDQLNRLHPGLDESLFRVLSQQLVEEQLSLVAIGAASAPARIARFLLKYGDRMATQGCSRDRFCLRMSRRDIGNYLGMKIETVSRTLTAMARSGIISVRQREVSILQPEQLAAAAGLQPQASDVFDSEPSPVIRPAASDASPPFSSGQESRNASAAKRPCATPWSALTGFAESGYSFS